MKHTPNPLAEALREHDYFVAGEIAAGEILRLESEKAGLLKALRSMRKTLLHVPLSRQGSDIEIDIRHQLDTSYAAIAKATNA